MSASIEEILTQALQALANANDLNQLDQVRVNYLGKKGLFTLHMKELGSLDPEQRKAAGQVINTARDSFQNALEMRKTDLEVAELNARLASERVDVSLPGRGQAIAGLHPVTITLRRISKFLPVSDLTWSKVQKLRTITTTSGLLIFPNTTQLVPCTILFILMPIPFYVPTLRRYKFG